jgi:hypothetical protein
MGRGKLWTGKRLRDIVGELAKLDIHVCANTVSRLLDQLGYRLHANDKRLSTSCPERDEQFIYMGEAKQQFAKRRLPIISVDSKKKEMIGDFKNPGRVWSQEPIPVNDHDFRSEAIGMAIPFGIYDPLRNSGSVYVGTSHDTPQFAVDNIARWWLRCGQKHYSGATDLLILADSGGSNGARVRLWKLALQEQIADRFGLTLTVCHFPTGASKWNLIEHRLFSEISKNWAGQPLTRYSTMVELIGSTRTQTGLHVHSQLITKHYPTNRKVSDPEMKTINIDKHAILPTWNYTISPRENRN